MTKLTGASYVKIALIMVFGALILGAIGFGGCSSWRLSSGIWGETSLGSASVDAADVKNLSIKWGAGEVKVGVTDGGDAIELIETSTGGATKAQQMRWSVSGDTLNVDYGQWFSCSALMGRKSLEVRIPKSYAQQLGTVDIDGASGDYDVSGLGCESLKLQLASGDLTGLDLRADELRVDVASGHLSVEGRFPDRVNVRTASGETRVVCEEVCPSSIDVDIASGEVGVAVPRDSGFTARIDKASGDFTSAFSFSQNGNVYTSGDGSASVNAHIASGEFRIDSSN